MEGTKITFIDDIILYVENPKESTSKNLLEPIE